LKRIVLLVTVGAVVAAIMAASGLSSAGGAQEATPQTDVCAPWSKAWDVSGGWWYFQWYRWCYDPAHSDPADESSWYKEIGTSEWWDKVNACPESGSCTMTTG
jgi:hypothetical protein